MYRRCGREAATAAARCRRPKRLGQDDRHRARARPYVVSGGECANPDLTAQQELGDWNSHAVIAEAARIATVQRQCCIDDGRSLAFATVFSAPSKVDFVSEARSRGCFRRLFSLARPARRSTPHEWRTTCWLAVTTCQSARLSAATTVDRQRCGCRGTGRSFVPVSQRGGWRGATAVLAGGRWEYY